MYVDGEHDVKWKGKYCQLPLHSGSRLMWTVVTTKLFVCV